ncbi:hypothetical protein GCM10009682_28490 [Luedemannella flava]|uniref:Uncharacterized protein n=1 Tax=Luedemannella flava TaxID=349316 RepID=A0ABP4Y9X3_9ACTN
MTTAIAPMVACRPDAALPRPYRVVSRLRHTDDTATIEIAPTVEAAPAFAPGQFAMVTAFGAGWCGHCQLGPLLLCRDGPVVGYDVSAPLLRVREL